MELSLQVLAKRTRKSNGMTTKLAATREVRSSRRDPIVCGGEGVAVGRVVKAFDC